MSPHDKYPTEKKMVAHIYRYGFNERVKKDKILSGNLIATHSAVAKMRSFVNQNVTKPDPNLLTFFSEANFFKIPAVPPYCLSSS